MAVASFEVFNFRADRVGVLFVSGRCVVPSFGVQTERIRSNDGASVLQPISVLLRRPPLALAANLLSRSWYDVEARCCIDFRGRQ